MSDGCSGADIERFLDRFVEVCPGLLAGQDELDRSVPRKDYWNKLRASLPVISRAQLAEFVQTSTGLVLTADATPVGQKSVFGIGLLNETGRFMVVSLENSDAKKGTAIAAEMRKIISDSGLEAEILPKLRAIMSDRCAAQARIRNLLHLILLKSGTLIGRQIIFVFVI